MAYDLVSEFCIFLEFNSCPRLSHDGIRYDTF